MSLVRYSVCDDCLVGCHKCCGEWLDPFGTGGPAPDPMPKCDCGDGEHKNERILGYIEGVLSGLADNPRPISDATNTAKTYLWHDGELREMVGNG